MHGGQNVAMDLSHPARPSARALVALLLAVGVLLGACGSDDQTTDAGDTTAAPDSTSTSTTLDLDASSPVALEAAAVDFGNTFLQSDTEALRALMTERCQEIMTTARTDVMLRLVLGAMERQQSVDTSDVVVESALSGDVEGTHGEAALVLNASAFEDPDFAFLQMQPYVLEDGQWRFDGCDTLKVDLGNQ